MKNKEIYWIVGTFVSVIILTLAIFGLDGFKSDSNIHINIYDTFYVIPNVHVVILLSVFVFFTVYLIRTVRNLFKSIMANLVLIIATIVFVVVLGKTIGMLDLFSGPPNNESLAENTLKIISHILFTAQLVLLVALAYFGFRTGQNYYIEKTQ
ncbi:hypothetical protein [Maribacter sp. LLG6340-A2]|uniref:hypothetical protein n=1 Tax=Maribacter sp. LLG6340-A2 TaxID=3160834 RepID=UPI003866CBAD